MMKKIYYRHDEKNKARYVLGIKGKNPFICFGVNPSIATDKVDDPTLRQIKQFQTYFGYDSYIVLNLYPQRKTSPHELDEKLNQKIHKKNLKHIKKIFKKYKNHDIFAAWGNLIDKRTFLVDCLKDINELASYYRCAWKHIGPLTKKRRPLHPLGFLRLFNRKKEDIYYIHPLDVTHKHQE